MNKTYAVFSTAVLPGSNVWGQTYPYGVMWDEPDTERGSHLWLTVPAEDEKKMGLHTHGINGRASQNFNWHPQSGILCGSPRKTDSEFGVKASTIAMGLETALLSDFAGDSPDDQLAAFRATVLKKSKLSVAVKTERGAAAATFTDHDGNTIERAFDGDTRINGEREEYEKWSLLENPWMRQEWDGNLTISDGRINRVYNVSDWTITETTCR